MKELPLAINGSLEFLTGANGYKYMPLIALMHVIDRQKLDT